MTFQIYFRYYSTRAIRFANRSRRSIGGPRGIRTLDLLNAIETRSQLRYGPICFGETYIVTSGPGGFEPSAFAVRLRRAPNCATGPSRNGIVPDGYGTVKELSHPSY